MTGGNRHGFSATANIGPEEVARGGAKGGRRLFTGVSFTGERDDDRARASKSALRFFRAIIVVADDDDAAPAAEAFAGGKPSPLLPATRAFADGSGLVGGGGGAALTSRNSEVMFDNLEPR